MKKIFTIICFCMGIGLLSPVSAQYQLIVAADGSGHYTSISQAMLAAADAQTAGSVEGRVRIFIKNGVYNEPVRFGSHSTGHNATNPISLVGESRDGVIIQYGNFQGLMDNTYPDKKVDQDYWYGTAQCATMTINGEDFYGENFTVRNTKDTSSVYTTGLYIAGRRQAYKNIKVEANRGAVYIRNGRPAFIMDSNIDGVQEMTCSNGTAVIYNTTIKTRGYDMSYAIPEDNIYLDVLGVGDTLRYGHIFRNCEFTAADTVRAGAIYLAIPKAWHSAAMFLNCKLGAHINPVGIKTQTSKEIANTNSYFGEYRSVMSDGVTPADVSQRAANCHQMSDATVSNYVYNNNIYNKFNAAGVTTLYYDPLQLAAPKAIPQNVTKSGSVLNWNDVVGAIGFVVYIDGAYAGMTETNSFTEATGAGTYTVCSVSESGAMSKPSGTASQQSYEDLIAVLNKGISNLPTSITAPKAANFTLVVTDGTICFESETDCQIFNLSGQCLMSKSAQTQLSLQTLQRGIYIIRTKDVKYGNNVTKVVL